MRQTGVVSWATVAAFKADTTVTQQKDDEVRIGDILKKGTTWIAIPAGAEVPDDLYTVKKTNDTSLTFWASTVNSLILSAGNLAFSTLFDNAEEVVALAVPGAKVGRAYAIGVVSGLPAAITVSVGPCTTADTLNVVILNNSGATLTAGTAVVNIYEV